jgi:hypothetical protein
MSEVIIILSPCYELTTIEYINEPPGRIVFTLEDWENANQLIDQTNNILHGTR